MNQPAAPRVQPVPRPVLMAEFRALLASGVLTDRAGAPLGAPCGCGGLTDGYTCPLSLRCPSCAEPAGRPCRRPSGHQAAETHAPRLRAAGSLDKARERDGDPTLPAPWPDHDPTDQILPKDRT
ncbi:hypothetical protein OG413_44640 [Streptomyces sp. NBC_01433]|uniref:zinc finger domain-containing protein n=1 Tax=Streptomyces sp. NBC_01433 TaxID=2903864 RepID=UPI002253DFB2|nr:hypothetical protein [Streptomyces sp. NBC_01433]MCX4682273.1 hypothetical protein [Streptomyces sp. NBC_01433]